MTVDQIVKEIEQRIEECDDQMAYATLQSLLDWIQSDAPAEGGEEGENHIRHD